LRPVIGMGSAQTAAANTADTMTASTRAFTDL